MSSIWSHATPKNPCPICGKTDWCTFGDKAMLCQRVESSKPHAKGGWFHFYENAPSRPLFIPKARPAPAQIDAGRVMSQLISNRHISELAELLGVSQASLTRLGAAWSAKDKAWAFPMSDGDGNRIGIRLRNDDAQKWTVTGSRQGVFLPNIAEEHGIKVAYLPEGPTDTAALLTMGLFAIGRPTCNSGNEIVLATLKRLGIYKAVIIADNDELKQLGPREGYPGIDGAAKLKKELRLASVIWMPPSPLKDVRAFLQKGGTAQIIESEIKNKIWSKQ